MKTRNNVRAIVYDENNGDYRFLLLRARKGFWESPGGGIEEGESDIEAAIRETREEAQGLGHLEIIEDTRHYIGFDTEKSGNPIHIDLVTYAVRAPVGSQVDIATAEGEHSDYQWVSYDEALSMLTGYVQQREVFIDVCKMIGIEPTEEQLRPPKHLGYMEQGHKSS
jgi:8-oxo-dGTP pyrophosphatase MutT (NUDIX family)